VAPNLFATLARVARPGTRVVWGVRASDMDLSRYGAFHEATFEAARRVASLADLVIANSESGRRFHVDRGYPADRTTVIPNGIDTDRFRPRPEARATLRAELGVPPDAPVIGIVARLDPMKGHELFLQAAARLLVRLPEVRFVVVGGGEVGAVDRLRGRATALGLGDRVRFVGPREDIERVYAALDVATSASSFGEGFPNAVAEAMASGVPCVVTDVGDSARIVGSHGVVVDRDDPDALARAWSSVLEAGQVAAPGSLRDRIVARFSVERLVERTESALAGLLEGRP
jgi:glycosyltransferase involved in cell wall biosynthesis